MAKPKNQTVRKIKNWDAVRSGAGITINGVYELDGRPVKLTEISRITSMPRGNDPREYLAIAWAKDGSEYGLI